MSAAPTLHPLAVHSIAILPVSPELVASWATTNGTGADDAVEARGAPHMPRPRARAWRFGGRGRIGRAAAHPGAAQRRARTAHHVVVVCAPPLLVAMCSAPAT